jgi:hypothetical protein
MYSCTSWDGVLVCAACVSPAVAATARHVMEGLLRAVHLAFKAMKVAGCVLQATWQGGWGGIGNTEQAAAVSLAH